MVFFLTDFMVVVVDSDGGGVGPMGFGGCRFNRFWW